MNATRHGCVLALIMAVSAATAQNIVENSATGATAPPVVISPEQVLALVNRAAAFHPVRRNVEAQRVSAKLDRHVKEFLDGAPWKPFHHTLGISGYETHFNHPDEMFYALSVAAPVLPEQTKARVKEFLARALTNSPPFPIDGFDNRTGRARESYDVPEALRVTGRGRATSAFGVYAFWAWVHYTGNFDAAKQHWPAVRSRIQPLVEAEYRFDIHKRNSNRDEAEALNGDLAGAIAAARLADLSGDAAFRAKALSRAKQLLELRVNLERVNPKILEPTRATKGLHASKLARFCGLTPEIGEALRTLTEGTGAARLRAFREERNSWHLAFGDRLIGGENYTNPMHFPRALFAGAAFVEQLPAEELLTFIDVPWCKGDFYFIEKCAWGLWADSGRNWTVLHSTPPQAPAKD